MSSVYQGFVRGRLATVSTLDLVRMEQGPTVQGRLNIERVAFLRAVASGISKADAMERYFQDLPPRERKEEAEATIAVARALARRHGDSASHLIGIDVWAMTKSKSPNKGLESAFDRDKFLAYLEDVNPYLAVNLAEEKDEEIRTHYLEFFPRDSADTSSDSAGGAKKENQRQRLVSLYVDAVKRLEKITIDTPTPQHPIKDWLPALWVTPLEKAGIATLDDLGRTVRIGGRWYSDMEGIRPGIASKIERYLERLLPGGYIKAQAITMAAVAEMTAASQRLETPDSDQMVAPEEQALVEQPVLITPARLSQRPVGCLIEARDDVSAIDEWIMSRCNSLATLRSYRKESGRFLAWMAAVRGGRQLCQTTSTDCMAYLTFLQNIPEKYITRRRLTPEDAGGLLFRGPLSDGTIAQARTIVTTMFAWLHMVGYLPANPWSAVGTKIAKSRVIGPRRSKAFDDSWLADILDYLAQEERSPAICRLTFVIEFVSATGLRPAELIAARIEHIEHSDDGLFLHVIGKGEKERWCVINSTAEGALRQYLRERGLPPLESCEGKIPLVSSTLDASKPVGYQALMESFTSWVNKIDSVMHAKAPPRSPSLHRLRHTFATQAVKAEVPYDVIQGQLGHASVNTTMSLYATAPDKRRATELGRLSSPRKAWIDPSSS